MSEKEMSVHIEFYFPKYRQVQCWIDCGAVTHGGIAGQAPQGRVSRGAFFFGTLMHK
jgi:hypothetical protein